MSRTEHLIPAGEAFGRGDRDTPMVAVCGEPVTSGPDRRNEGACVSLAGSRYQMNPVEGA